MKELFEEFYSKDNFFVGALHLWQKKLSEATFRKLRLLSRSKYRKEGVSKRDLYGVFLKCLY